MSDPAIGFLNPSRKLGPFPASTPLDTLTWPLGLPERLQGGLLRDLGPNDHLVLPAKTTNYYRPGFGTRAKVSVLMLEPQIIHAHHIARMRRFHWRFHKVMTFYPDLLETLPNAVFMPFGGTWVPEWQDLTIEKTRLTSLIASAKRSQPGHVARHSTIDWARAEGLDLDALGGGYAPFADKHEGLAPYRFSVVIENVREPNYFSEKLIDAILCETVPIYLGCPNIADFMDTSGMILCDSEEDIRAALNTATPELYDRLRPALLSIKASAADWSDTFGRAARYLLEEQDKL